MSTVIRFSNTANISQLQALIEEHKVKFIDLRFTDLLGKEQHVTIPSHIADTGLIETGKMFDGSSIKGWQSIDKSDLIMKPDLSTSTLDPFCKIPTLILSCDIMNPDTSKSYDKCPRSVAQKAEAYLKSTGIADTSNIGPEPEFFIFDKVLWRNEIGNSFYRVESKEAAWNSDKEYDDGSFGHRPAVKGGYFPVPPVDSAHGLRSDICTMLESVGIIVEAHHHEVATCNQNEITFRYSNLLNTADQFQLFKYIVMNVAHAAGKTVTFMPKPLVGDNGSGMHCHQSLSKNGENIFAGDQYGGLSETALHYIGGIIKHAGAISAFTNPTTNSYKRLVPGFEAPTLLTYSARNRSAAIRLPYVHNRNEIRIEVRFPDPTINPYLAFSAMLMAGIDGIKNKIDPGDPADQDLYTADADEISHVPTIPASLEEAVAHLENDHNFLLQGDVFTSDLIKSYIALKQTEIARYRAATHPVEFEMYYSS